MVQNGTLKVAGSQNIWNKLNSMRNFAVKYFIPILNSVLGSHVIQMKTFRVHF